MSEGVLREQIDGLRGAEVGGYEWRQLSMWDMDPVPCVIALDRHSGYTFRFYLRRFTEVNKVDGRITAKSEVVTETDGVPEEVLGWRGADIVVKQRKG